MNKDKGSIALFSGFLLPTLIVYGIFIVYPIFSTLYNSFFDWNGLVADKIFIGFENYKNLFTDEAFLQSIQNNVWVVFIGAFVQIPLGFVLALIISKKDKRIKVYKVVYFIPYLLSTVAIGLTWGFLYDPMLGPINYILELFGVDVSNLLWLADKKLALIAVLNVVVWNFAPFYMILFNASLSTISKEYYEAASIDGASTLQKFRHITLPLMIPAISNAMVLSLVGSLKSFDLFYVMTRGGPGSATELMGTYMYKQGFTYFKMGYASSVAFSMFFLTVISMVIVRFVQSKTKKDSSY